jgi:putative ABC transport system permease protein
MLAIGAGARRESIDSIRSMGIDTIILHSKEPTTSVDPTGNGANATTLNEFGLKKRDLQHIRETFENVRDVVPVKSVNQKVFNKGLPTDVKLLGVTPGFLAITNSKQSDSRGRWLVDLDEVNLRPVCVVGQEAARKLFRFNDPLGRVINIGNFSFEVVGILKNPMGKSLADGNELENLIYAPFSTVEMLFLKGGGASRRSKVKVVEVDHMFIRVKNFEAIENTSARLRSYLDKTHARNDYTMKVPKELLRQEEATQRIFTIVMASIAAISLLIGGIGIMNIMLANVYERTREIGTLRALGAKRRDILIQFVVEAIVLTGSGGALGVILGVAIARLVERFASMHTEITLLSTVPAFAVSLFTGLVFGTYPAWRAAKLHPIEALRRD